MYPALRVTDLEDRYDQQQQEHHYRRRRRSAGPEGDERLLVDVPDQGGRGIYRPATGHHGDDVEGLEGVDERGQHHEKVHRG